MGKKRKLAHLAAKTHKHAPPPHPKNNTKPGSFQKNKNPQKPPPPSAHKHAQATTQEQHQRPTIPFHPDDDRILLVGEGDLSFAAALVDHHGCQHVTATVLEPSRAALVAKYPQAAEHLARLEAADGGGARVLYGVDAKTMGPWTRVTKSREPGVYNGARDKVGAFDRILFNFPHVGGKSTDVNRQVRHNQELLVAFFRRALPSLAPGGTVVVTLFEGEPYTLWNVRDLGRHAGLQVERSFRFQFGAYPGYHHARTLGVVRRGTGRGGGGGGGAAARPQDAGRGGGEDDKEDDYDDDDDDDNNHAEEAEEDDHVEEEEEEEEDDDDDTAPSEQTAGGEVSTTAWRGEDRAARSYVFIRKGDVPKPVPSPKKKRKRAGDDSSDSDDEE